MRLCGIALLSVLAMRDMLRRTVDTLALLNFNFAKVLDTHGSSYGKVSQRMVVLLLASILCARGFIYRDSLLLPVNHEIKSSKLLESMSFVLTIHQL